MTAYFMWENMQINGSVHPAISLGFEYVQKANVKRVVNIIVLTYLKMENLISSYIIVP
jgi:hypothetical protein